jgi:signal transduction histidine kinase
MLQRSQTDPSTASRYFPLLVTTGLSLLILAGTVLVTAMYVRAKGRDQIIGQEARILYELWLAQKSTDEADLGGEEVSYELRSIYETRRLPQLNGLYGTRLFDTNGGFVWADLTVAESTLAPSELAKVRQLKPVARFREAADLTEVTLVLLSSDPATGPLLEVCIPLHTPDRAHFIGAAQFLLDGSNVAAEFDKLDRTLSLQATVTFLTGGGLLGLVLGIGFTKLQRTNQLLAERSQSLLRANQELALAAKTSAVGAVTAHLIHGLKNPLSGLQTFVASRSLPSQERSDSDWELAVASTRRMQSMINQIVRVLHDEQGATQYELSLRELSEVVEARVRVLARDAGVEFGTEVEGEAILNNREASLISLVLYNLVQNAIQATPQGKTVTLRFVRQQAKVLCQVRDQGPGITDEKRAELFKPCRSSKEGGTGIGLAISKQLAHSVGADLDLKETSSTGSVFELTFEPSDNAGQPEGAEPACRVGSRS